MTTGYQQYRNTQTTTADPGELLLMLYDGALRFTRRAIQAVESGDVKGRCEAIARAFAIITELHATLDFEVQPEITGNLASLYLFVLESYTQANALGDATSLESVLPVLENLREGWDGAVRQVRRDGSSRQTAPVVPSLSVVAE